MPQASRREKLAALAAFASTAAMPAGGGVTISGLEHDLPPLSRDEPSYEQMVHDYIDVIRDATPEAFWDGSHQQANRFLNAPGDGDAALWDPYNDHPLDVEFAAKRGALNEHGRGSDARVEGLYWPAWEGRNARIDIDPHSGLPWWTEGSTLHELSHAAVDAHYGHRGERYNTEPFNHGPEWQRLLDIAVDNSDMTFVPHL